MVKWIIQLVVVVVVVVVVGEVVVDWKFFNQELIILVVWSLVVIWSWSHCGRPCCEGVALERIQLRVHIGKVPLLVDNLAWGGWLITIGYDPDSLGFVGCDGIKGQCLQIYSVVNMMISPCSIWSLWKLPLPLFL